MADVIPFGKKPDSEPASEQQPHLRSVNASGTLEVPLFEDDDEIATLPDPRGYLSERLVAQPTIANCRAASLVVETVDELLRMSDVDATRLLRRMRAAAAEARRSS